MRLGQAEPDTTRSILATINTVGESAEYGRPIGRMTVHLRYLIESILILETISGLNAGLCQGHALRDDNGLYHLMGFDRPSPQ